MKNEFLLSVITPTYNSDKTISNTLESIKMLKEKSKYRIEHIIIDGVSSDKTLDIIRDFDISDVIFVEKDKGIYDALNKGINISRGKYICSLMSDDIYNVDDMLCVLDELNDYDYDYLISDLFFLNGNEKIKKIKNPEKRNIICEMPFNHPCLFIRNDVQSKVGFYDLKYKISSDYEFAIRLLNMPFKYKYLNRYCIYMADGGASDLQNFKTTCKERLNIRIKYFSKNHAYVLYFKEYLISLLRLTKRKIYKK
ncbi:TPA: glycosyltransferase [Photobacterium damselae]